MKRRHFLICIAASLAMAGAVQAASFADAVIAQLTRQGFAGITSESTWLGRVRITAQRDGGWREIVLNPRTGEILRDIWSPADGSTGQIPIVDDVASGGASGSDDHGGGDTGGDGSGSGHDGGGSGGSGNDGGSSGSDNSGSSGGDGGGSGHDGGGGDGGSGRD